MKSRRVLPVLFMILAGIAALAFAATELWVQVDHAHMLSADSFLSPAVSELGYGESVELIERAGDWRHVRAADGKTGWVHISAMTRKEVIADPDADAVRRKSSGEDIILAGLGFNRNVETQIALEDSGTAFAWVDAMEVYAFSPDECAAFLAAGEVGGASR